MAPPACRWSLAGAIGAYGYGLAAGEDAIARTLDGIPLDAADMALEFDAGALGRRCRTQPRVAAQPARRAGGHGPYPFRLRSARHDGHQRGGTRPAGAKPRRNSAGASPSSRAPASRARSRSRTVARSTMRAAPRRRSSASCWRSPPPICGRSRAAASGSMQARAHDLLPPHRRCRPVSDHRQIPRAAPPVGTRRGGLRPGGGTGLHHGGDRLAHDDAARPLREHAARDHRGVLRRRRRRRRHHGAAVHARARPARPFRAAHRAQHAARPARRNPISPRSPTRRPAQASSRI